MTTTSSPTFSTTFIFRCLSQTQFNLSPPRASPRLSPRFIPLALHFTHFPTSKPFNSLNSQSLLGFPGQKFHRTSHSTTFTTLVEHLRDKQHRSARNLVPRTISTMFKLSRKPGHSTTSKPHPTTTLTTKPRKQRKTTSSLSTPSLLATSSAHFSSQRQPDAPPNNQSKKDKGDSNKEGGDGKKEKGDKKPQRSWLQIYGDMTIKQISGPLTTKHTKNTERQKARAEQMRDLLTTPEIIEKLIPALRNPNTTVWFRRLGTKEPPELLTYAAAQNAVKGDGEHFRLVTLRSASQKPPLQPQFKGVLDDGILPMWSLNLKEYMDDLHDKDTVAAKGVTTKDISINSTITRDDLHRKVQQAIEFLLDGNNVHFNCQSKTVAAAQQWVQQNTHFSKDEIESQTQSMLSGGKSGFQHDVVHQKLKASNQQLEGETDQAYSARVDQLVEAERERQQLQAKREQEEKGQQKQLTESRIAQSIQQLLEQSRLYNQAITDVKLAGIKEVQTASKNKSNPNYHEAIKTKAGKCLPAVENKINLFMQQIEAIETELLQWRDRDAKFRKGFAVNIKIPPYLKIISLSGQILKDSSQSQNSGGKKVVSAELGAKIKKSLEADDAEVDFGDVHGGGGDDFDDDADRGGGGLGGDELPDDDTGVGEDKLKSRAPSKMSKTELEKKKKQLALEKLNAKERVEYLAELMANQQYGVIGDVVTVLGKLSTIIQQERQTRKKTGEVLTHDEMSEEQLTKLSNKDQKRYQQRLSAIKDDPNAFFKLELANAWKLFGSNYVYNDVILETQLKRPFWCSHDGGQTPEVAASKPTLNISIVKSALEQGRKM